MSSHDPDRGIDDRMARLRGEPEHGRRTLTRKRRSGGIPGWLLVGTLALLAAAGVYLFESRQTAHHPGLVGSTTKDFPDGRPLGTIDVPIAEAPQPAAPAPLKIEVIPAAAEPAESEELKRLRQVMLALEGKIDGIGPPPPDRETQRLLREALKQNEKLARDLVEAEQKRQRDLAAARELFETELEREMMALRTELAAAKLEAPAPIPEIAPPAIDLEARRLEEERLRLAREEEARLRAEEEARAAALEKRRQEAAELAKAQIESPAVIFDDGGHLGGVPLDGSAHPQRPPNANAQFAAAVALERSQTAMARPLSDPGRTIVEGTFIQGVLETAIDSSLPGGIRAAVAEDVYSYDGRSILLPRGTRLIGTYRSDLSIAQERALVVWTRAVTPAGLSVQLGSTGADRLGRAGLAGDVDTHFFERFGSAALISVIGAIPAFIADNSGAGDATQDVIEDIGNDFQRATSSAVEDYLRIQPTIHVDQGDVITVFVGRDLVIPRT